MDSTLTRTYLVGCVEFDTGFDDAGAYWRSWYESEDLVEQVERLFQELSPLYDNLHAYVRRKMYNIYGSDYIDLEGPIPAHVLGKLFLLDPRMPNAFIGHNTQSYYPICLLLINPW